MFAIQQGLINVVKASITGSILGNLLFLLGIAILFSTLDRKETLIPKRDMEISTTMLMLSTLALLFPSLLFIFHEQVYVKEISIVTAGVMLATYLLSLVFSFHTHKEWFSSRKREKPSMRKTEAILLMLSAIIILSVLSEYISTILEDVASILSFNELFMGAIVIGIVGNIAEYVSAITLSIKSDLKIAFPIAVVSSLQVALFVVPVFTLFSLTQEKFMSLSFLPVEIVSIFSAVLLANEIARDGRANWLEGVQLIALYVLIALIFFFKR